MAVSLHVHRPMRRVGAAGIVAARDAKGPGSYRELWLDALHALTPAEVVELVNIEEA